MANRYCNLVGSNKIKDEWEKINQGFDAVEADMDNKLSLSGGTMTGFPEIDANPRIATDLNNETKVGTVVYESGTANSPSSNLPDFSNFGVVLILRRNDQRLVQLAIDLDGTVNARVAFRVYGQSGWGTWRDIPFSAVRVNENYVSSDFNNITTPLMTNTQSGILNRPPGTDGWGTVLNVMGHIRSRIFQIANMWNAGNRYFIRRFNDTTWSPWFKLWHSGEGLMEGNGSPEGVITAPVGTIYMRLDGAAGTTLYVKRSGTGNTGWFAVA